MTEWSEETLREAGYDIWNARITSWDLSMEDHGCLTLDLSIKGDCRGTVIGGYILGNGYVGANKFIGSKAGTEYIMRVLDTVGVPRSSMLTGSYVRVASKDGACRIFGNVIEDKWFDIKEFFAEAKNNG